MISIMVEDSGVTDIKFKPDIYCHANSPETLAKLKIYVDPESLPKDWGPDRAQRYMTEIGIVLRGRRYEYVATKNVSVFLKTLNQIRSKRRSTELA